MPRRVVILGSTGSIGVQALEVIGAAPPDTFEVVGLSAGSDGGALLRQARAHGVGPDRAGRSRRRRAGG